MSEYAPVTLGRSSVYTLVGAGALVAGAVGFLRLVALLVS